MNKERRNGETFIFIPLCERPNRTPKSRQEIHFHTSHTI